MLLLRWDYLECEGIRFFDHSSPMTYDDRAGRTGRLVSGEGRILKISGSNILKTNLACLKALLPSMSVRSGIMCMC